MRVDHDVTLDALLSHVGPAVAAHPLALALGALVLPKAPLLALVGRQALAFWTSLKIQVKTIAAAAAGYFIQMGVRACGLQSTSLPEMALGGWQDVTVQLLYNYTQSKYCLLWRQAIPLFWPGLNYKRIQPCFGDVLYTRHTLPARPENTSGYKWIQPCFGDVCTRVTPFWPCLKLQADTSGYSHALGMFVRVSHPFGHT